MKDFERKVGAACLFATNAEPTNLEAYELGAESNLSEGDRRRVVADVKTKMQLHRGLLRGNGFYWFMAGKQPSVGDQDVTDAMGALSVSSAVPALRPLPVVNFLDMNDKAYEDAVVEEALPADRQRFRAYLSTRPLGVGIITAVSSLTVSLPSSLISIYLLTIYYGRARDLAR